MSDVSIYLHVNFGGYSFKTVEDTGIFVYNLMGGGGGIGGRGIQTFDAVFWGMSSAILPPNLVTLAAKMWDIFVFYRFAHRGVSTCYRFPRPPEVVEPYI